MEKFGWPEACSSVMGMFEIAPEAVGVEIGGCVKEGWWEVRIVLEGGERIPHVAMSGLFTAGHEVAKALAAYYGVGIVILA